MQTHSDQIDQGYLHFLGKVRMAVQACASNCVLSPDDPTFHLEGVQVGVRHIQHSGLNWLQIDFTMIDFEVTDAATLARLLQLNHDLASSSPLVGYFALRSSDAKLQFIQRTTTADLPVWALEKYFVDTVGRLNQLFVTVVVSA